MNICLPIFPSFYPSYIYIHLSIYIYIDYIYLYLYRLYLSVPPVQGTFTHTVLTGAADLDEIIWKTYTVNSHSLFLALVTFLVQSSVCHYKAVMSIPCGAQQIWATGTRWNGNISSRCLLFLPVFLYILEQIVYNQNDTGQSQIATFPTSCVHHSFPTVYKHLPVLNTQ